MGRCCGTCIFCNDVTSKELAGWGENEYECSFYFCTVNPDAGACHRYEADLEKWY